MKDDRIEENEQSIASESEEPGREFPRVKTGIKAGPETDNLPPIP